MNNKAMERFNKIMEEVSKDLEFKKDYLVNPKQLKMNENGFITLGNTDARWGYDFSEHAGTQFANRLGIPANYFNNIDNHLKAYNANYLIEHALKEDQNDWMFRTLEKGNTGRVRGVLSSKYSKFDNHELLDIVQQAVGSRNDLNVDMFHHDDQSLHLRLTFDGLTESVGLLPDGKTDDIHKVGLHIANSEVGCRSIQVVPVAWRKVCKNGMMGWASLGGEFVHRHIGINHDDMFERVSVAVAGAFTAGGQLIEILKRTKQIEVENPTKEIEKLCKENKLSQKLTESIKESFRMENVHSVFYVAQSFTNAAQQFKGDRRVEIENIGARYMESMLRRVG